MIKVETLGMLDIAKINPVLTAEEETANYSVITKDGTTYLISNTITGDDSYKEDVVIPAGECLNGYDISAWTGQKLVVDGKHVKDGIAGINVNDKLKVGDKGQLEKTEAAPETGVYFVVTDKGITLTEPAIKVKVAAGEAAGE